MWKPGQLVTIKVKETAHVYRITKVSSGTACNACETTNGKYNPCLSIPCDMPHDCYPKLVKLCGSQDNL